MVILVFDGNPPSVIDFARFLTLGADDDDDADEGVGIIVVDDDDGRRAGTTSLI